MGTRSVAQGLRREADAAFTRRCRRGRWMGA
ncbi:hypothetical protein PMIN01_09389 [Paraphaeosphaeria minitans]|uniref:Uncharacterized protein n=1 Tax=Paraphaeosphaeria minitans TaxID=565426 RepID=A0A9P6GBB5_9PLEO|nr:hypothetical protein PMIN01_09389 [Paraphaeosphaeria minitans]